MGKKAKEVTEQLERFKAVAYAKEAAHQRQIAKLEPELRREIAALKVDLADCEGRPVVQMVAGLNLKLREAGAVIAALKAAEESPEEVVEELKRSEADAWARVSRLTRRNGELKREVESAKQHTKMHRDISKALRDVIEILEPGHHLGSGLAPRLRPLPEPSLTRVGDKYRGDRGGEREVLGYMVNPAGHRFVHYKVELADGTVCCPAKVWNHWLSTATRIEEGTGDIAPWDVPE
jgi:hypothetical protein